MKEAVLLPNPCIRAFPENRPVSRDNLLRSGTHCFIVMIRGYADVVTGCMGVFRSKSVDLPFTVELYDVWGERVTVGELYGYHG